MALRGTLPNAPNRTRLALPFGAERRIVTPEILGRGGSPGLVVAAANSYKTLQQRADFVCGGGGDELTINRALGLCDTVYLCPGLYTINPSIVMGDYQSLIGSGFGCKIQFALGTANLKTMIVNADDENGNKDICIAGLRLDGQDAEQADNQSGIWLTQWGGGAGGQLAIIRDCFIEDFGYYGIRIDGYAFSSIIGNVLKHLDDTMDVYAIYLRGSDSDNNLVVGNSIEGSSHGICVGIGTKNNLVVGNVVRRSWNGISVAGAHSLVQGNRISETQYSGIIVLDADHSIVGNFIEAASQNADDTYAGIQLGQESDHVLVADNVIRMGALANQPNYGIGITAGATKNVLHGNDLYTSGKSGDVDDSGTDTRMRDNIANDGTWLADV